MGRATTKKTREEKPKVDSYGHGLRRGRTYETTIGFWNPGRTMYTYFPLKAKPKDKERVVVLREGKHIRCWKFEDFYFEGDRLILENATRRLLSDREMSLAHILLRNRKI